ncbi:hypothetical protein B0H11DRAFT_2003695 [Mycena galericulata]|nr:hypothetical protein B0H11DRAFT_2003695 [Mycena galericulata]
MKFFLLSATVLASTTLSRAYICTTGMHYCGYRFIGIDNNSLYYGAAAAQQSARDGGIYGAAAKQTLFRCTSDNLWESPKYCGEGNCINPGGGNNDYCIT